MEIEWNHGDAVEVRRTRTGRRRMKNASERTALIVDGQSDAERGGGSEGGFEWNASSLRGRRAESGISARAGMNGW